MFDLEFILKGVALVVAIGLLLSSVDFSYLLAKISVKDEPVVVVNNKTVVQESFSKHLLPHYFIELTNYSSKDNDGPSC